MKTLRPEVLLLLVSLLLAGGHRVAAAGEVPLTLEECLRRALEASLQIREGRFVPEIAETYISEAESEFEHLLSFNTFGGKSRIPSGTVFAGGDKIEEQSFGADAAIGQKVRTGGTWSFGFQTSDLVTDSFFYTIRPAWTNSFSFRVRQPVLRRGGISYNEANIRSAEASTRAARAEYRNLLERTLAGVERSYWLLVYAGADLEVKRHSLRVAEELLRISRRRLEAGAGTRIEVVQAEAGIAQREKELILAEHRLASSRDVLRSFVFPFVEKNGEQEFLIAPRDSASPSPTPPSGNLESRIRLAFERRPDVEATKEALEAAGIRVSQRENELLPQVDAFGRVGLAGLEESFSESSRIAMSRRFPTWEVGISVEIPLGNEAARSRHRRSLLERAKIAAGFETLKNQVVVDVRDAWRLIETSRREIEASRRAVAAAQAQFEAERDRVEAEKSTNYQLLETEQDLSEAKSQELFSLVGYRIALVNIEEATGTYLETRGLAMPEGDSFREDGPEGAR
jgi:outer membrane protein TolC